MAGGRAIPPSTWQQYAKLREMGVTLSAACRDVGITRQAAYKWEKGDPASSGHQVWLQMRFVATESPKTDAELSAEAKKCRDDFARFRRRYFGRRSVPWQEDAAEKIRHLLETPAREYVVINVAPGTGKSTLFTHDIPAWLTVRDRTIRGLLGSRTQRQANTYLGRLRNSFDRPPAQPMQASANEIEGGMAFDAKATLYGDYGRFRPSRNEGGIWSTEQLVVAQPEAQLLNEKEPTWAAFGFDSGYLGHRVDFAIWDDLVDFRNSRNIEARETLAGMWEDIAEARVEPGGLCVLQGQRISGDDLYRHCLDMVDITEIDADPEDLAPGEGPRKYHHIVYPAHDEGRCDDDHGTDAKAWPDGCLIDPKRLPWRELRAIAANRGEKYRVIYQQEDTDPNAVLVNPLWVKGGVDPTTGIDYPGCWDDDRGLWELPEGLVGDTFIFAAADPSPTKWWSVQLWAYHHLTEQFFLLDMERKALTASEFLDFDPATQSYVGLMHDWQVRSQTIGRPIQYWIVEQNAAQRFLLQYIHVRNWMHRFGVEIVGHSTHSNKADPEFGVQALAPLYRHGKVRLPRKGLAYQTVSQLVSEVTRYPEANTDDCVMAQWFGVWQLPNIFTPDTTTKRLWTPSWMREGKDALMAQAGLAK